MQNPEGKLASIRRSLLLRFPFLGSIVSSMEFIPDSSTDRFSIYNGTVHYSEAYLDSVPLVEARFQLARLVMHVALNHGQRRGLRNRDLWSVSADIAVDGILSEAGLTDGISGVLYVRAMNGKSAEEIYSALSADAGIADAGLFNFLPSPVDSPTRETLADRISAAKRINRSLILLSMSEGLGSDAGGGMYSARMREIVAGARITAILAGKNSVPAEIRIRGDEIQHISLRRILEPYMEPDKSAVNSFRFSRKYLDAGIYLPGRGRRCLKAVVAIDVSASVDTEMAEAFFSDTEYLLEGLQPEEEIRLLQFDTDILYDELFSGSGSHEEFQFIRRGIGGTDFNAVLSKLSDEGNTWPILIITDGKGETP
ncbi:MAG: VWA-like domain-containing protein, partial [Thermoplasmataceae archaeon]